MTQNEMILAHLQKGKPITPLQALREYGCLRLGARIFELRRNGYNITERRKTDPRNPRKHFSEYRLAV